MSVMEGSLSVMEGSLVSVMEGSLVSVMEGSLVYEHRIQFVCLGNKCQGASSTCFLETARSYEKTNENKTTINV